jgi:hypothetical protein
MHHLKMMCVEDQCVAVKNQGLNVAGTPLPHTSASWLSVNEEALFALAYSTGPILLIRMDPLSGMVSVIELKQETMVPRFLSGIAGALRWVSQLIAS